MWRKQIKSFSVMVHWVLHCSKIALIRTISSKVYRHNALFVCCVDKILQKKNTVATCWIWSKEHIYQTSVFKVKLWRSFDKEDLPHFQVSTGSCVTHSTHHSSNKPSPIAIFFRLLLSANHSHISAFIFMNAPLSTWTDIKSWTDLNHHQRIGPCGLSIYGSSLSH